MQQATLNFSLPDMVIHPANYRGKLFVLGGIIASTRLTEKGSLIEALCVPVDSNGYLLDLSAARGRFLALYPKGQGLLDPLIYTKGRKVTVAGEFLDVSPGKIDDMGYAFPFFEIKDIYLWQEIKDVRVVPYPYPWYPYPYWPYYYDWPYYRWNPRGLSFLSVAFQRRTRNEARSTT
jgi:outer membrane lipoprotein